VAQAQRDEVGDVAHFAEIERRSSWQRAVERDFEERRELAAQSIAATLVVLARLATPAVRSLQHKLCQRNVKRLYGLG